MRAFLIGAQMRSRYVRCDALGMFVVTLSVCSFGGWYAPPDKHLGEGGLGDGMHLPIPL